jgi:PAS domain S-box-containing protein
MSQPIRAPDLVELESLVVCAAEGSLAGAASALGISRPAVAKRIRNLEALAGRPLLHRGARGVRLTNEGATIVAAARPLLAERDRLLDVLRQLRGGERSAIDGVRTLLGGAAASVHAAQRLEARLVETERVLELVLSGSASGVIIADPETGFVHEANDAACRFLGQPHEHVVGRSVTELGLWVDADDPGRQIDPAARERTADVLITVRRADETVRVGKVTARVVELAGTRQLLWTVDDVTTAHELDREYRVSVAAYRAVTETAALLLTGRPVYECLGAALPALRRSGRFRSALLWDSRHGGPLAVDGEPPPPELESLLAAVNWPRISGVARLRDPELGSGAITGLAAAISMLSSFIVLLPDEPLSSATAALYAGVLADLVRLVAAAAGRRDELDLGGIEDRRLRRAR